MKVHLGLKTGAVHLHIVICNASFFVCLLYIYINIYIMCMYIYTYMYMCTLYREYISFVS